MTKESKEKAMNLAELTCKLARACNRKEHSFAALFGLTPMELKCLRMFAGHPSISISDIIKELEITAGRVTHILTSLEQKKYITRRVNPKDKRNYFVDISPESKKFINQLTVKHTAIHQGILTNIKESEQELLFDVMKKIIVSMDEWTDSNRQKLKK